jgi:ribosomal protein L17
MSSKSDDAKLAKLVRKNAAKAANKKAKAPRRYDDTLVTDTSDDDLERRDFFSEMKKREF